MIQSPFETTVSQSMFSKFRNLFFAFSLNLIWVAFIIAFLRDIGIEMTVIKNTLGSTVAGSIDSSSLGVTAIFFLGCFFAPLWEELAFRYFPIRFAKNLGPGMLTPMIILSSIVFGICHQGVISILFQGVGGLIISWVYLKNGSYWWAVFSHSLWNIMILFGLPLLS